MHSRIRKNIALMGLLLAIALILSYVESLVGLDLLVPGVKLGLSNLSVLMTIVFIGIPEAFVICVLKVVLAGSMFGNMSMMIYGLCGSLLSFGVMAILVRIGGYHLPVISATGGVFHNMGQMLVALFVTKALNTEFILFYIPVLIISGFIAGLITGIIANLITPALKKAVNKGDSTS
ncbi:MAG: Gx transporter family protein [Lachnospiraceae bacterium]|nr:Gx transporter family protein [Lachnospiraceae bacterium]